jgi:hypothetical protein
VTDGVILTFKLCRFTGWMTKDLGSIAAGPKDFYLLHSVEALCYKRQVAGSIPDEVIGFFNDLILPAALCP